ncbi:MAG: AMP-binding protein, partial [Blastocatellia bacterium]
MRKSSDPQQYHLSEEDFRLATIVEILRFRANCQPDRPAFIFLANGETVKDKINYFDLDRRAQALGAHLQSIGAGGERALLLFPPGIDFIIALMGCLYAGAIAIPVYPPDPARFNRTLPRFEIIVKDAQPSFVLTDSSTWSALAELAIKDRKLLALSWVITDEVSKEPVKEWRPPAINSDSLAFLQYTSGSTSSPRGVMITHGNIIQNQRMIMDACAHSDKSTFVGWLPLYHDMGLIGNVLQPLFIGAKSILMSPADFLRNPFCWLQAISHYKAATSGGPNFAYDLCSRRITAEQKRQLDLANWTVAFNGSEPVYQETMDRFADAFEPCGFRREAFYPCYGLAEATLIVTGGSRMKPPMLLSIDRTSLEDNRVVTTSLDDENARMAVSCGQALQDERIVIVAPESLTPVPPDRVGEIWVSGLNVARGYWGKLQDSEQTFNAYLPDSGDGPFLRTGDLGFLRDEELYVTGRLKDLIIIRGRNHYPQDFERTIGKCHKAVRPGGGAAFSVEINGDERLVIVQEVDDRAHTDLNSVIEAIRQAIAEYHQVRVYAVDLIKPGSIPKTSSGKIQRHACREGFLNRSLAVIAEWRETKGLDVELPQVLAAPGEFEPWLAHQLAYRLGISPGSIDAGQPLTLYGIDSLIAIEFAHAIESSFGVTLPVSVFLRESSIAQLASEITAQMKAGGTLHQPGLSSNEQAVDQFPLSAGQQALWFLHKLDSNSAAYNIASAVEIRGDLNVSALRSAFQKLLNRHPQLRATFIALNQRPVQQIHTRMEVCFREEDASSWDQAHLDHRLVEEAHHTFDLEQGPLLKVNLFARSFKEHVLLLVLHHIISDFWSLAILVDELGLLYRAEKDGNSLELSPIAIQYHDYVRWQAELLEGEQGQRLSSYWRKQLADDLSPLNLPLDRIRPPIQTFDGASLLFDLDSGTTERLKDLAHACEATLYVTLLAAFKVLLFRYTNQKDLAVGTPTTGRASKAEFGKMIGFFVNPVVIRTQISGNLSYREFLRPVRQTVLDAFEHQEYPFARLVEQLQPVRDASRSPFFQVMFVLQKSHLKTNESLGSFALGEPGEHLQMSDLDVTSMALEQRTSQLDVTLMMAESGGRLKGSFQYNTNLFDAQTISRMAEHFQRIVEAIIKHPDQQISEIGMLSEGEKRQIVSDWNQTATSYRRDRSLHDLFTDQARLSPDSIAVSDDHISLTYSHLDCLSTRLACDLRREGLGPEKLVGICLRRSAAMVAAMLGVLKSGAAYVPIDSNYPADRINRLLEESGAELALVDGSSGHRLCDSVCRKLWMDGVCEGLSEREVRQGDEMSSPEVEASNLAYVIYTSGSTGRPKGVMIEHCNAVSLMNWAQQRYSREEMRRVLAATSVSFDLSVYEIYGPLSRGGEVVVVEDVLSWGRRSDRAEVSLINTVPSAGRELVSGGAITGSVKVINLAGEALSRSVVEELYEATGVARVMNLYGPSEDTTYSTEAEMRRGEEGEPVIGTPISNREVYILEEGGEVAAVGVIGEIYLGGEGQTR